MRAVREGVLYEQQYKRKYCSPKCGSDHFRANADKEYVREYKKMYARLMAGKISRDELKSHMSKFRCRDVTANK